ncbi:hypothetical protein EDB80DRAFT_731076 [Ilyonectria destructans]|nr:hypothetical protein EDB80DRAFT_731076 [Ilyonectria destructans]
MQNGETILQFTASGPNSTCTLKLGLENSTIGVSGFIVTTIEALHTIPTTPDNDDVSPYKGLSLNFNSASLDDFRSSISKIIQVWKAAKDTANFTTRSVKHYYRATKESVHGAFRQTIVAGRIGPDKKTPLALQFSDLKIFAEHATILPWDWARWRLPASSPESAVKNWCWRRCKRAAGSRPGRGSAHSSRGRVLWRAGG